MSFATIKSLLFYLINLFIYEILIFKQNYVFGMCNDKRFNLHGVSGSTICNGCDFLNFSLVFVYHVNTSSCV